MNAKQDAQERLKLYEQNHKFGFYEDRNGKSALFFMMSLEASTMVPLVHYFSPDDKSRWTKNAKAFFGSGEDKGQRPPFRWLREASPDEILDAMGIEV